jgi:hypothetical protein
MRPRRSGNERRVALQHRENPRGWGNKEKAFEWLERAYAEGNPDLIELNSEPVFDDLRKDPRLSDLMR